MKPAFLILAITVVATHCTSQDLRILTYPNGLIYDDTTIARFREIVDSQQKKFTENISNRPHYSLPQTHARMIQLCKGNIQKALADIRSGISYNQFLDKYPRAVTYPTALVFEHQTQSLNGQIHMEWVYGSDVGEWWDNPTIIEDEDTANAEPDPDKTTISGNHTHWIFKYELSKSPAFEWLTAFYLIQPLTSKKIPEAYSQKISYADFLIDSTTTVSPKVVSSCGNDPLPYQYLLKIATLAAEAGNWPVFLRAHLAAMNGYDFVYRKTYATELEEMNINVPDLLLGITLETNKPALNHFQGYIPAIGRAVSAVKQLNLLGNKILSMIGDTTLDDYNRLCMHNLFLMHIEFLPNRELQTTARQQLKKADKTLPSYMRRHLPYW